MRLFSVSNVCCMSLCGLPTYWLPAMAALVCQMQHRCSELLSDQTDKTGHRLYVSLYSSLLQLASSRQGKCGSGADSYPPFAPLPCFHPPCTLLLLPLFKSYSMLCGVPEKRKEKTLPFGVNLMRSQASHWAAQIARHRHTV